MKRLRRLLTVALPTCVHCDRVVQSLHIADVFRSNRFFRSGILRCDSVLPAGVGSDSAFRQQAQIGFYQVSGQRVLFVRRIAGLSCLLLAFISLAMTFISQPFRSTREKQAATSKLVPVDLHVDAGRRAASPNSQPHLATRHATPSPISLTPSILAPTTRSPKVHFISSSRKLTSSTIQDGPDDPPNQVEEVEFKEGFLVRVPLPINQEVDSQVRAVIDRVIEQFPPSSTSAERPVVVLEFDTVNGATGEGSQLERCIALARYLTGPEVSRVRTVAYIPAPRGFTEPGQELKSQLFGHAVLVAIACEEIVMQDEASIGNAAIDEAQVDALVETAYRSIAERRRTLPVPLVTSLIDRSQSLYRVTTPEGVLYLDERELNELQTDGRVISAETLSESGSLPEFGSEELMQMQLISHRVSGRQQLARRYQLRDDALQGDPSIDGGWKAVLVEIAGPINQADVNWAIPALQNAVNSDGKNLVIVRIDSVGGSLPDGIRLAQILAEFESSTVRTVAYVPQRARGPAAVVALACDHLVMTPDAMLGGLASESRTPEESAETLKQVEDPLRELAKARQSDWSPLATIVDPHLNLIRIRNRKTGELRALIDKERQELANSDDWGELGEVEMVDGIDGQQAQQLQLARILVANQEELFAYYQLSSPPESLQPTATQKWIEELGRSLASPWIAGWLLFGAMFFLSTEFSQPGLGVPGFLSAVCFFLFFWSQYLDGNVQWFELLLLGVGFLFVLLEIFVLPGFGIFGVGGLIMIVVALVLSMQDFGGGNSKEALKNLPQSLAVIGAGLGGTVVATLLLRRFLPHVPFFNKIILSPPTFEQDEFESTVPETKAHEWIGEGGTAITRLNPAGKVRIGSRLIDVVTDGRFIEKGAAVVVQDVHGNRVVVMPAERANKPAHG